MSIEKDLESFMEQYPAAKSLGWNGYEFVPARESHWQRSACENLNPLWNCWKKARAALLAGGGEVSKTNKPLLAYHVGEGSEGEQVIVFATSSAAGRRKGGNELDLMFEEVEFCRRAPWADQYAGQPFIPAKAFHDAGWWLHCNHCGTKIYDDAEDDDGNPLQIVYDGRHAYCDSGCKAMLEQEIARYNAAGQAFKERVMAARPDLTFTDWRIGWPHITQFAKFTFPGGKYGGSVRDQEGDGNLSWYIAQGDQAAWDSYESVRASTAQQGEGEKP